MSQPTAKLTPTLQEIRANPVVPCRSKVTGMISMGFDLSSTCCGWAVMENTELVRYGKILFKSTAEIGAKLLALDELVQVLLQTYKPDVVILEAPLSKHAKVTARHFELVGIVRYNVIKYCGFEVTKEHFISPLTVKKAMGVPKGRDHDHNKEIMVNRVNDLCDISLKYDSKSSQSDDDIADAIAVLLTWHKKEGAI